MADFISPDDRAALESLEGFLRVDWGPGNRASTDEMHQGWLAALRCVLGICPECRGTGNISDTLVCTTCNGTGETKTGD